MKTRKKYYTKALRSTCISLFYLFFIFILFTTIKHVHFITTQTVKNNKQMENIGEISQWRLLLAYYFSLCCLGHLRYRLVWSVKWILGDKWSR